MTTVLRATSLAACLMACSLGSAAAQAPKGLTGDLIAATAQVEKKFVDLAGVMTPAQYAWRPAEGVRSVGEVLMHVAADNYFLPAALGVPAPAATKITATDYAAVQTFERQKFDKDATIAELKASFEHLRKAIESIPASRMDETIKVFGQDFTVRGFLILATTHLHEHMGQMIAYARSNGVTPPWSR